jgi:hypothetical protein
MQTFNRRAFLKRLGAATGAAVAVSPVVATAVEPGAVETVPSCPVPPEPVVAIVRDAGLGEVTVLSGATERTYKDRALVRRLLKAAERNQARTGAAEGDA